jgi:hypothetical protein
MKALALSEFYGFAKLRFVPSDITVSEEELKVRYNAKRVPEFVAGQSIVEVKRIKLDRRWNIEDIVRKACEKGHKELIVSEKIHSFYICYVLPVTSSESDARQLVKQVKAYTHRYAHCMFVRKAFIVFARAPDDCFVCE